MNISKRLGFAEDLKLLMIHADDAGLSHSENMATIQSLEKGIVNSYSIMVPCPWFNEIASFAKNNAHYDYGIHLTLTCEWENYKFGPVLPHSLVPGLVDSNGNFHNNLEKLNKNASATAVEKELQAQIEKALDFGLKPTHIDSHMYSVGANPEFLSIYKKIGRKYGLPVLLNRQLLEMTGLDPREHINKNDPVVDKIHLGKFEDFEKGELKNYYKNTLKNLSEGINVMLIHPAFDDEEMKGITVNHPNFGSAWRQLDFEYFTSDECKLLLEENNIQLVSWHDLTIR